MDKRFFISHSSVDRPFVSWLASELKALSIPVWYSDWDIKVGDSIVEKVDSALDEMAGLVVVLSSSSIRSKWVREELSAAVAQRLSGKAIGLFPVKVDDIDIPPLISHRRYADFTADRDEGLKALLEALVPAASLLDQIKDLKNRCGDLCESYNTYNGLPDAAEDELWNMVVSITSLLETAVDIRFDLEMRKVPRDRRMNFAHPEKYRYLVNSGYELRSKEWGLLVALRSCYLHEMTALRYWLAKKSNWYHRRHSMDWILDVFDELLINHVTAPWYNGSPES